MTDLKYFSISGPRQKNKQDNDEKKKKIVEAQLIILLLSKCCWLKVVFNYLVNCYSKQSLTKHLKIILLEAQLL